MSTRLSAKQGPLTEDTPLTPIEQKFITNYIRTGLARDSLINTGLELDSLDKYTQQAYKIMRRPNVRAEIQRIMAELEQESVATAREVMEYFTSVMRGEIKDQFGLDAPLSERTKAAQEIAKRTIDMENRMAGNSDHSIQVTLNWKRDAIVDVT